MNIDDLVKLDPEDLEGVAGGKEPITDTIRNVYWDIERLKKEGKTRAEAYAYCEERYADSQPEVEPAILAYLNRIYS